MLQIEGQRRVKKQRGHWSGGAQEKQIQVVVFRGGGQRMLGLIPDSGRKVLGQQQNWTWTLGIWMVK